MKGGGTAAAFHAAAELTCQATFVKPAGSYDLRSGLCSLYSLLQHYTTRSMQQVFKKMPFKKEGNGDGGS